GTAALPEEWPEPENPWETLRRTSLSSYGDREIYRLSYLRTDRRFPAGRTRRPERGQELACQGCRSDSFLGLRVAGTQGDRVAIRTLVQRPAVDRDAVRCPGFVHAGVAFPDGAGLVVLCGHSRAGELLRQAKSVRRVLLGDQREHPDRNGGQVRGESPDGPIALVGQVHVREGPEVPVDAERELENVRKHTAAVLSRHGQVFPRTGAVAGQVVVPAVVDRTDLLE